jgi:hypothetical protein
VPYVGDGRTAYGPLTVSSESLRGWWPLCRWWVRWRDVRGACRGSDRSVWWASCPVPLPLWGLDARGCWGRAAGVEAMKFRLGQWLGLLLLCKAGGAGAVAQVSREGILYMESVQFCLG